MDGWIKLHRQIKEHWLWRSNNRLKWWIDILLTVNHNDAKVLIKGTLIECKRGQSIRSLESWAKDWNISKGAVRDFFKLLQSDEMLIVESLKFTTRITVCKYEDYQTEVHEEKTQRKRRKNTEETQVLPKQEGEERKERKEPNNQKTTSESDFIAPEFKDIFDTWLEYKKEKKESYKSQRSIKACYESLLFLSSKSPEVAKKIVNQSMANNWKGLFELKGSLPNNKTTNGQPKLSI